ncbi:unnamed protein product [Diatraea saccharalis]|uniref:Uncharacterized protein n=1 Tax=Diatraea saccharalis TaxID=40085 RepID=A0A9N9R537_9NEOP|nr:unnamed protein product [Diatraea saccharalis]
MFNVKIGYDITAVLDKEGTHRFTGIYNHNLLQLTLTLTKNLASGEFTAESSRLSVSGGSGVRMVYMPESSISEVLSRRFLASSTMDNLRTWTNNIIIPILFEKTKTIEFPGYCVHC